MNVELDKLSLAALATIDGGRIARAFDLALEQIRADLVDRAVLVDARKLSISVNLVPIADEAGELDGASVSFDFAVSVPKRKTKPYTMLARDGALLFNEGSPKNPRQLTIPVERVAKKGGAQ